MIKQFIQVADEDNYCNICKDREKYDLENVPVMKIVGDEKCYYCGNEIVFCKKHWELFKQQFKETIDGLKIN